jgi:hypothetical protein
MNTYARLWKYPAEILLRTKNVSDKRCIESQKQIVYVKYIFFPKIVPFMRQCGDNTV